MQLLDVVKLLKWALQGIGVPLWQPPLLAQPIVLWAHVEEGLNGNLPCRFSLFICHVACSSFNPRSCFLSLHLYRPLALFISDRMPRDW